MMTPINKMTPKEEENLWKQKYFEKVKEVKSLEKYNNQVHFEKIELLKSYEVKLYKMKKQYEAKLNQKALLSVNLSVYEIQIIPQQDNSEKICKVLSKMTKKYDEQIKIIKQYSHQPIIANELNVPNSQKLQVVNIDLNKCNKPVIDKVLKPVDLAQNQITNSKYSLLSMQGKRRRNISQMDILTIQEQNKKLKSMIMKTVSEVAQIRERGSSRRSLSRREDCGFKRKRGTESDLIKVPSNIVKNKSESRSSKFVHKVVNRDIAHQQSHVRINTSPKIIRDKHKTLLKSPSSKSSLRKLKQSRSPSKERLPASNESQKNKQKKIIVKLIKTKQQKQQEKQDQNYFTDKGYLKSIRAQK